MILSGCQSASKFPTIIEKICPQCGNEIELFSTDTEMVCEKCGFVVYNDILSCVQWCPHARECVGDVMYEHMMKIIEKRKADEAAKRAQEKGE